MTDTLEAPAQTDAELRTFWQQAGGTIYSANSEIGSMPVRKLLPFLRGLLGPGTVVVAGSFDLAAADVADLRAGHRATLEPGPAPAPAPDSAYARALMWLVAKVCPGLDTGNLLEDARKACEAMDAGSELAGHFGLDEKRRHQQVLDEHAGDEDIAEARALYGPQLLPCAHCDGKVIDPQHYGMDFAGDALLVLDVPKTGAGASYWGVRCFNTGCGASVGGGQTPADAVTRWNRRPA